MIEEIFRDHWGRLLASLVHSLGDLELAEDALAQAFASAVARWPQEGTPANPRAWLLTTARNSAIDVIRRERRFDERKALLVAPESVEDELEDEAIRDDRLAMFFGCAHPALSMELQVALTLRYVAGMTTEEIAMRFLVGEEAMKKRLTRAKARIREAGIPFAVPPRELLDERLDAVLAVVYLIYNEGYGGREDFAAEAIHVARVLAELMPDQPEVLGLLALMLLQHSRRAARHAGGELVLLGDQDRQLWDAEMIAQGQAALRRARTLGGEGAYVLQASIASLQMQEPVDWTAVEAAYARLAALTSSPVVELNRAVALAQTGATDAALAITDGLQLEDYPYLHSTRAELFRRLGRVEEAAAAYQRARELTQSEAERRFLSRRLEELEAQS